MPTRLSALVFGALTAVVVLFQLALAAGAPWGEYAMGGAFPGRYPPPMRIAALVQAVVLVLIALAVLTRVGLVLQRLRRASRVVAWGIVALLGIGVVLNLITPSGTERLIWAPVAAALFAAALHVAWRAP